MNKSSHIISISGSARSGKDTLADNFIEILESNGIRAQKLSFAYELKKDCDPFLKKHLGISAFTEDPEEKKIIRPFLVFWGTDVMRKRDPMIWVERLKKNLKPNVVNIISDLRFVNEFEWAKRRGSCSLFIERNGVEAANSDEEENNLFLKKNVDLFFNIAYLEDTMLLKLLASELLVKLINKEILTSWKATCPL
jgi:hypothetical protein